MSRPIIAVLTDFGTHDHYVGTMKGVVLSICPEATLVDISHQVPPQDVLAGALTLADAYRYFPAGTIFLAVVDPGVGSSRRAIAAAAGDYAFVGPDNGLFTAVFEETPPRVVIELTEPKYALPTVSRTFEGRDRFAPAAAWIATGIAIDALGAPVSDYCQLPIPVARGEGDHVTGVVLRVDRFGNLITNIDRQSVDRLTRSGPVVLRIGRHEVAHVVNTYADAPPGELCALVGSTGRLEVAVNGGSAAERLGAGRGATVNLGRA